MRNSVQGILLLLVCGVIGAVNDEVKSVSVFEGDSVTLRTDTNLLEKDKILWRFEVKGSSILLVEMSNYKIKYEDSIDVRLRDRLLISDTSTGDLTIKNMRIKHTGLYKAEINTKTGISYKTFSVTVNESLRYTDAGPSDVKSESVMEGKSVTLQTDVQTQKGDLIQWRFGDKNLLIAKGDMEDNKISYIDDDDGRFSGRLKLNDQTGDLTITNIINSNAGVYNLKIISNRETKYKTFTVSLSGGGLSSGAVAGLCIFFLLVIAGIAVCVILYLRMKLTVIMMSVSEGDTLTLLGAESRPQPGTQIEWKFKGRVILTGRMTEDMGLHISNIDAQQVGGTLDWNPIVGHLIISNILKKDTGLYEVKITNDKGTSHRKTQVNVIDGYVTLFEGGNAHLHGADSVLQTGAQIEWKFNNHVIITGEKTEDKKIRVTHSDDQQFKDRLELGDDLGYLIINKVSIEDSGVYEVNIIYNNETTHNKTPVNVIAGSTGEDLNGQMGGRIVLTMLKGDSAALRGAESELQIGTLIEWTFKDRVITTGVKTDDKGIYLIKRVDQQFNGRLKFDHSVGYLFINDISEQDSGVYEVKITNNKGTSRNKTHVIVIDKIMSVAEGDSLTLPGAKNKLVIGAQIEWKFNNRVITSGNMRQDAGIIQINVVHQQFNGRLKQDPFYGSLTINDISKEDIGLYEVNITNKYVTSNNRFHVDVIVSPRTNKNEPEPTAGMALLSV